MIALTAFVIAGCTKEPLPENNDVVSTSPENSANVVKAADSMPETGPAVSGLPAEPPPVTSNATATATEAETPSAGESEPVELQPRAEDRFARIRGRKSETKGAPTSAELEEYRTRQTAPDDSYFYTELTDVAIETRVFRSHPHLAKVERINDGKNQAIKVYLKSGGVVELPGGAIKSIASARAAEILTAAGIKPDTAAGTPTGKPANGQREK